MSNEPVKEENSPNSWMGPKGFDEARYYKDEKYEIGIKHPDERIKAQVEESYSRNPKLASSEIDVEVKNGVVTLSGVVPDGSRKKEASDSIHNLSGVKMVRNLLRS